MKTAKPLPSDLSSNRRAQPLRQTRNNPPRSSVAGSRQFGSRVSLGGLDGPPSPEQAVEIFPAITHFADAITALPKELVRHFTLLKEVDAKIFAPQEDLGRLVDAALNTPLPERKQHIGTHHTLGPTSAPMSAQNSVNSSMLNGHAGYAASPSDVVDVYNPASAVYDPANVPRRQLFQHVAFTMQNMLVSLDEKNHVISTAAEALSKQLARIDDCFPHIEDEISEEARFGSTTHWAYPENRIHRTVSGGNTRRDLPSVNNLSAAAQHLVDEAAARSDARKQALAAKKNYKQHESDFDDHHDARHRDRKVHGNSKVRKAADTVGVGLGIANGAGTNGNPPKRRKVEKAPNGGAGMERALSGVFGNNGTASKKAASPRGTPPGDGPKKRQRGANATNGQTRKRNNTVTSVAMSPSIASSPIRSTFPEVKASRGPSPQVTNGGRPTVAKGRQNSTQSLLENGIRPSSPPANKQNNSGVGTPDLGAVANVTGRSIAEVKASMKESGSNSKGEHLIEDVDQDDPGLIGGLVVGNRKDISKREVENSVEPMQGIQTTTITTKSGRASKPSTPAIPQFPESIRSRSSRNTLETTSSSKRSHKKGAGAAAQQQLLAQQMGEEDDASSVPGDDEDDEINPDEPRYCYCNGVSYGEMVGCDSETCTREWFHLECVGLDKAPSSKAKWYCDDCKKLLAKQRFNSR